MKQQEQAQTEPHYYSARLQAKLAGIRRAPAVVVEAPSGYGKTTAIRDFFARSVPAGAPVHWFTAADESPAAGFRRLCREIDQIDGSAGARLLKLELPNAATVGEACDALRSIQCVHETYLVIDNFELLHHSLPPSFFLALFEHGGQGLHVVILTQVLRRGLLTAVSGRGFLHITAADLRLDAGDIVRYFAQAGVALTIEEARSLAQYTEGWIIAVYLQLRAFRETGSFPGAHSIITLMERLIWDGLSEAQQSFLLRLSPFERLTVQQACALIGSDALPEYALDALERPFIRYEPAERRYELHGILSELLAAKRVERGEAFARECLLRAGDLCREEGKTREALGFYWRVRDHGRILTLDFSRLLLEQIGNTPFVEIALELARTCPEDRIKAHPLPMLRVAWALRMMGKLREFDELMDRLAAALEGGEPRLLGEWTLLASFRHSPRLGEMTAELRKAELLLAGQCSQVILPESPWAFGNHSALVEYHVTPGEAEREAEAFEEYLEIYSRLTGGNGSGADALFRAELAYQRGRMVEAEVFAYKAVFLAENHRQSVVQLGATQVLAHVALHNADAARWQHALTSMERAASFPAQDGCVVRALLDIVRGVLLNELQDQRSIAAWLQTGEFTGSGLPPPLIGGALFVYLSYLMHEGQWTQLAGTAQALMSLPMHPYQDVLFSLTLAVAHNRLGNREEELALVRFAASKGLPDGLVLSFAAYSTVLGPEMDNLLKAEYPESYGEILLCRERFLKGWRTLYGTIFSDKLTSTLTEREHEVARLAASGLRNSEIASRLAVTESTVRAHLRVVFQKLDIDRRARLAEKLK